LQKSIKFPDSTDSVEAVPFRLKGGLFPLTLLEINRFHKDEFEAALRQKSEQAPAFFKNTPVVFSVDELDEAVLSQSLGEIIAVSRQAGLLPVAIRTAAPAIINLASECGLAVMPVGRVKPIEPEKPTEPVEVRAQAEAPAVEAVDNGHRPSRVITTPIRSGQQVYAQGGDLIVMAQVSAGAEILADGNIHIYGPLRGRALAGVMGNTEARIFCQSLEAELISIAGIFKLDEDLRGSHWKQAVQASLSEQALTVEKLS
jgi:septum site-determining protein MinC